MTAKLVSLAAIVASGMALGCSADDSPREVFRTTVMPVLERRCASTTCHGVAPDAIGEQIDWNQFFLSLDAGGRIADVEQAYAATKRVIDTAEDSEFSTLLRKPLPVASGGIAHLGGHDFASTAHPDYRAMRDWIAREHGGGEDPPALSPLERVFETSVQPALVEATCFTSRCHGPTAGAIPYHLDPGYKGRFPIAATRHNYRQTLSMASLDGHPRLSRLLRKSLPLGEGIVHKGMNFDFFAGNLGDAIGAISAWICAERRARTGLDCKGEKAATTSFVYVRGPAPAQHPFRLDVFAPGSDLFLGRENLTASLHPDGPADVRDPAVSRDGARVLFSMRRRVEEGHRIWVLDLATREARQLTSGAHVAPGGGLSTDRDPTFGPDGSVWFVSTRAGVVADQGTMLDAEIYALDPKSGTTRRWTYTPHIERKPVFFDLGGEAGGQVAFSALRDAIPGQARAHVFRFPPSQRTEYHQHFGITPVQTFFYDMRELPDGRYLSVVGDLPAVWQGGRLSVVDRNLGPEINGKAKSSVPALESYAPPLVLLEGDGLYRDPAPLPDGRILVSHQPAPFDAADPAAPFAPRLELLELEERTDGAGPRVSHTEVLVEEPGVALTDPEPVVVRAPVRQDDPALPPNASGSAVFRHQGVPIIDALLSNLPPSGTKHARADIAYVRLVEHLPMTSAERSPVVAEDEPFATTTALGPHGPSRILAEVPLAADGSFEVTLPANVPFRLQSLNAARMAIGAAHNRWYYTLPGQVLTQGVSASPRRFGSMCGACHGDADGTSGSPPPLDAPDAITGASLTWSRFDHQNPRRPLKSLVLGDATRLEIDFVRDVQPILDKRCARCHTGTSAAGGVELSATPTKHFSVAYETLLRPGAGSHGGRAYVDDGDGRATQSYLVELLLGRELDAPRALLRPGTPHPNDGPLTDDELLVLVRWIDLGATFVGLVGGTP